MKKWQKLSRRNNAEAVFLKFAKLILLNYSSVSLKLIDIVANENFISLFYFAPFFHFSLSFSFLALKP